MKLANIFLVLLALFVTTCNGSCNKPTQHNQTRYGTVTVAFAQSLDGIWDFNQTQRSALQEELNDLSALGPTFVLAPEGSATYVIRAWSSGGHCEHGAGQWTPGTHFAEVDATCTGGLLGLRTAVAHELGHMLGMQHICMAANELTNCSPVGYGPAIMNPNVSYGDPLVGEENVSAYTGVPQVAPSHLDILEYSRVHP